MRKIYNGGSQRGCKEKWDAVEGQMHASAEDGIGVGGTQEGDGMGME